MHPRVHCDVACVCSAVYRRPVAYVCAKSKSVSVLAVISGHWKLEVNRRPITDQLL